MLDSREPARKVDFLSIFEPKRGQEIKITTTEAAICMKPTGSLDKVSAKKRTFAPIGPQLSDILCRPPVHPPQGARHFGSLRTSPRDIAEPRIRAVSPARFRHVGHEVGKIRRSQRPVGLNGVGPSSARPGPNAVRPHGARHGAPLPQVCTAFGAGVREPVTTPALSRGPS